VQRCLQEKATNISWWQSGQRTRAKPSCRSPHLRKAATDCYALSELPAGNVITPFELGNLVPAYTDHRVWLGHWFMTPNKLARIHQYDAIVTGDPTALATLTQLVDDHRIQYVVVPTEAADHVAGEFGDRIDSRQTHGTLELLVLTATPQ